MEATTAVPAGNMGTSKGQRTAIKVLIGVLIVVVVLPVVLVIMGVAATFALRSADAGGENQTPEPVEVVDAG